MESVFPEDFLYVAVVKVITDFGQGNPEIDYVMDGIVNHADLLQVIEVFGSTQSL